MKTINGSPMASAMEKKGGGAREESSCEKDVTFENLLLLLTQYNLCDTHKQSKNQMTSDVAWFFKAVRKERRRMSGGTRSSITRNNSSNSK